MKFLPVALIASALLFSACGDGGKNPSDEVLEKDSLSVQDESTTGGVLTIQGKLFSVPSPVETALLIKRSGVSYKKELLLDKAKVDALASRNGKALALGAYGADLAYRTIHGDGQGALGSLQAIERLSGQLEVGNAFDKGLLERFKAHSDKEDSLLRLSGEAFRSADAYLKNNDRNDLSGLILTGGWIETLHLAAQHAQQDGKEELMQRIGSQGRALKDLIALLEANDADGSCKAICTDLRELEKTYAGITSTYSYEEPVTKVKEKTTYINSNSTVQISAEQVKNIAQMVGVMRTKYMI